MCVEWKRGEGRGGEGRGGRGEEGGEGRGGEGRGGERGCRREKRQLGMIFMKLCYAIG